MYALLTFSCTCFREVTYSLIEGEESSGNIHAEIRIYYGLYVQLTWLKAASCAVTYQIKNDNINR